MWSSEEGAGVTRDAGVVSIVFDRLLVLYQMNCIVRTRDAGRRSR
jgi:hypothetical protein